MVGVCPKHGLKRNKWHKCSDCFRETRRRYESTEKGKLRRKDYDHLPKRKRYRKVLEAVRRAIRSGVLTKQPCVICNNPKTQAHHLFGYEEENWLRVVFLCKEHHTLADKDPVFNETLKGYF